MIISESEKQITDFQEPVKETNEAMVLSPDQKNRIEQNKLKAQLIRMSREMDIIQPTIGENPNFLLCLQVLILDNENGSLLLLIPNIYYPIRRMYLLSSVNFQDIISNPQDKYFTI